MSSPATANFLAAWRQYDKGRIVLCKIELTVPSSRTLRYATTECHTPDGSTWQAGLTASPLRHAIPYLSPGVGPAEATIRLAKRRDASQTSGTIHDLLSDFLFQNAVVTLYRWSSALTDFADALQVYRGVVSRPAEIDTEGVTLHLLQDMTWNKQTPPTVVDKTSYPNSPDVSQGLPIPIIYGDHRAPAMRSPWTATYTNKSKQEDAGAGQGVVPLVLVDAGLGSASVKLVAAGHECTDILDRTAGMSAFIVGDNLLNPLDTAGLTESLGASESYLSLSDENAQAYAAIIPIDVRASENTALNPRRSMDPFDETSFASIDQNSSNGILQLILPNPAGLGRIESVQVSVAFIGNASNTHNLRADARKPGVGAGGGAAVTTAATGTTPAVMTGTWPASYYTKDDWNFGGDNANVFDLRIDFVGGSVNRASIIWAVLVVKYRPNRSVVTPGKVIVNYEAPRGHERMPWDPPQKVKVPETLRLDGQFYGNLKGHKDDGSGTYTGSAGSLIEQPPDIMRHFLATYGLVSGGNIETGASAFGSFVLARSVLRNAESNFLKLACWIGERTSVQRVLQSMAEQSGMCVYLDRYTNKWLAFVWKPGAAVDYDRVISWHDLSSISAEETSVVDVKHAIRVKFGFDHFKSKMLYEAFVTAASSGQGVNLPTIRDQRLVVVNPNGNEDLDFFVSPTTYFTALASGTYAPIDLASELRSKMRALAGNNMDAGYGFSIKAGFNDKLDFDVAGNNYVATLAPGDYTGEGLAVEVVRAIHAVGGHGLTFSGLYDHANNRFTFSASGSFRFDGTSGAANYATSAVHALGDWGHGVADTTWTALVERYGDRFWIGSPASAPFNMLWGTGAGAATNCALLLGYPRVDSGSTSNNPATYSRGDRERTAETFQGYYGPREELQVSAAWIRDENTAVQLRNRLFDLTARPRAVVKLSTFRMPDVRVMQVFNLDSDVDSRVAYPKYGSDGSWSGKPLRVLEVEQNLGPSHHDEILAIGAE